jgi:hypothetical protein
MRISPSQLSRVVTQVAVLLTLMSTQGAAQATTDSTKVADPAAAGYGDSARQSGVDTLQGEAAAQGKPAADSGKANPGADSYATKQAAPPAAPADSVLSGACSASRPGTLAPGLLLVLFRDSATEKQRSAAVTSAGGMFAGRAQGGGDYVRPSADTVSSRDLADRLVQDAAIASISERTCPVRR